MVSRPANLEEEKTTNDKDDWDNEFAEETAFVSLVDVEALNKHGFEGEAEASSVLKVFFLLLVFHTCPRFSILLKLFFDLEQSFLL